MVEEAAEVEEAEEEVVAVAGVGVGAEARHQRCLDGLALLAVDQMLALLTETVTLVAEVEVAAHPDAEYQ